ncbi:MAG: sterol desaturase family protein [Casimicrobiaceae bacterium]
MSTLMRLSKVGYYADFVVYPGLLLLTGAFAARSASVGEHIYWLLSLVVGLAVWPLLEYLAHRFILHRVPPFREWHALHHATPTGLVGTPTWLSVAIVGGAVFLPMWREAGLNLASGLTTGIMLGYLWYVGVHHAVHHWRARRGSYLFRAKLRHALHHRAGAPCNFGVTTDWWDRAFGSDQRLNPNN